MLSCLLRHSSYCIVCSVLSAVSETSLRLTNVWFVTKQKKLTPTFLCHVKRWCIYFCEIKNGLVGDVPFYLKFWTKLTLPPLKHRLPVDICLFPSKKCISVEECLLQSIRMWKLSLVELLLGMSYILFLKWTTDWHSGHTDQRFHQIWWILRLHPN